MVLIPPRSGQVDGEASRPRANAYGREYNGRNRITFSAAGSLEAGTPEFLKENEMRASTRLLPVLMCVAAASLELCRRA